VIRAIRHPHKTTNAGARHHPNLSASKTLQSSRRPMPPNLHYLERVVK
jgi:hypothetical protein